jgi:hypothetical protein
MASASDWRSADNAKKLMQLDRAQFALEFLRRNADYIKDYRATHDRIASGALSRDVALQELAQRWGLTFPASTRRSRLEFACYLAAGIFTLCCHHYTSTRVIRSCTEHFHR